MSRCVGIGPSWLAGGDLLPWGAWSAITVKLLLAGERKALRVGLA